MGSNMMRQSVPLMNPEPPIVATGMESVVAKDSRAAIYSDFSGIIEYVDSNKIIIKTDGEPEELELMAVEKFKEYNLNKFLRTNQNTCTNQRPVVSVGDK